MTVAVVLVLVAVLLVGTVVLGVLGLRVWHAVRDLGRAVGEASDRIAVATDSLAAVTSSSPDEHAPRHAAP